jgi:hypothetical protein
MLRENTDPHPDGPTRFLGRTVSFDDPAAGATSRRLVGVVDAARYIGRTSRGSIPDYRLTVRGKSGRQVEVSLVESRASIT